MSPVVAIAYAVLPVLVVPRALLIHRVSAPSQRMAKTANVGKHFAVPPIVIPVPINDA